MLSWLFIIYDKIETENGQSHSERYSLQRPPL